MAGRPDHALYGAADALPSMDRRYPDKQAGNGKVLTVIGNRPQFIKAAAVSGPLRAVADEVLVHTGQHYDEALSQVFFDELGLPRPEHRLELGGGSNAAQTARMLAALEPLLAQRAARARARLRRHELDARRRAGRRRRPGIPVAHVEAGMRSYDRTMPEELNRVLTDHASDLLLCSSEAPAAILRGERVAGEIEVVGDVMVDVARLLGPRAAARTEVLERFGVAPGRVRARHRAPRRQRRRPRAAGARSSRCSPRYRARCVLPLHPRTAARLDAAGLRGRLERAGVVLAPPLGYLDFTALLHHARAVLTDSGGVQKEAYLAGRAVRDAARDDGVDRDGGRRLERARRPRRRRRRAGAGAPSAAGAAAALRRRAGRRAGRRGARS